MINKQLFLLKSLFNAAQNGTSRRRSSQRRFGRGAVNATSDVSRLLSMAESLEDRTLLSATSVLEAKLQHTLTGPAVTAEAGALFGYSIAASASFTVAGAPSATVEGVSKAGAAYVYANSTGNLLWTLHDPTLDPSTTDGFGFAVAVSDQWIIVSNNHSDPLINKPGEVHIFSATTGAFVRTIANPEPSAGDRFGETLAISGNTLAVGAIGADAGGLNSGTVFTFNVVSGQILQTIENPTHAAGDNFGRAIAMSGNNLVIGALFEDTGATNAGSAYVFNAVTGELIREFNNPTPQTSDEFGTSVAIDGDVIAIQAHKDNTGATQAGSVYLYRISTSSLVPFRTINNPTPSAGDEFGYHVSLSGNNLAVGVPFEDVGATNAGVLYVYDITTNASPLVIGNPAAVANDFFAFRSVFVGTDILVSAAYDDISGIDAGTVYRFAAGATTPNRTYNAPATVPQAGATFGQRAATTELYSAVAALGQTVNGNTTSGVVSVFSNATGEHLYDLTEPVPTSNRYFGAALEAEGDYLIVAPVEASTRGAVYVYQLSTGELLRTFTSPDNTFDGFGIHVAVSGDRLLVGGAKDTSIGKAWVFDIPTGNLISTINNPEPNAGDGFGATVALEGTVAVIGATGDDFGAANSGSAYVFNALTGTLQRTIRNPSPGASDAFPYDLSMSNGRIIGSSMFDDTTASDAGIAYIFDAATGATLQTLTNPIGGVGDWFGYGVAISGNRAAVTIRRADRQFTDSGAVAVFDVSTGALASLIDNPNPSTNDYFGESRLGLSGNILTVGATAEDRPTTESGAAYIYQLQDSRLSLVKDIMPGGTAHSSPSKFFAMGDVLFFSAFTSATGSELWRSDGTDAGTYMVRDIQVGTGSSSPSNLATLNGSLVFSTSQTDGTRSLWKSDGTASRTQLIKSFASPVAARGIGSLVDVNGVLYFYVDDGVNGDELWKSDGTTAGTVLVKNIRSGNLDSDPDGLINVAGTLFFSATDDAGGTELWKSDGTSAGTVRVKDINPGTANASPGSLLNGNGTLYFTANDGTNGFELWKSDGTSAGTVIVKNIRTGTASSSPGALTMVGTTLFFSAADDAVDRELWKSDGTSAGTIRVKDIFAGSTSSSPASLVNMNGRLYFVAGDSASGRELWRSDGTTAGTLVVRDISTGTTDSTIVGLVNLNGLLYFRAQDSSANGAELWRSDGTSAGTMMVTDVTPASGASSNPQFMTAVGRKIFAQAVSASFATELWAIDAVSAPTVSSFSTSVAAGGSKSVTLAAVDRADAPFTYSITQSPAHGTLSGTAPNLTYTPNPGFVGTDEFYFTATNTFGPSSEGRIEISVYGTPSTVSFSSSSSTVAESVGATNINVTLTPAVPYDTTVRIALGGTAIAGLDYRKTTEVIIPAGSTSATVSLGIIDDTRFEGTTPEDVLLAFVPNPSILIGSQSFHIVQITDNDTVPKVSFERPSLQLAEGSGTTQIGVVLDAESTLDVVVPLQVVSSAANGTDFTLGATSVTIPAGSRSATFSLTIIDDSLPEMGEFIVIAPGAITNATLSTGNTATQFIKVDIPPNDSPIVNMVTSGVYVSEGVGTVTVTATLSEAPTSTLNIPFSLAGQMTLGTDFTVSANAFSFAAGSRSASVTVSILDELPSFAVIEPVESVVLVINRPSTTSYLLGSIGASAITVADNDTPKISFSTAANSYWENEGNVTITATLSVAQPTQVVVPVSVSSALAGDYATNGTDFELLQPSFVFGPNSTTASVTFRIINNPANEPTERVVLRLDAPFETVATSPNGVFLGTVPTTEIRILDDDPFVTVLSARYNETNGDGFFTFTLSAPSNRGVTVPFSLGGDAKAGSDYTRPSPITVTIPAGQTSTTLPVRLRDDSLDERDEQITLTMGTPNNSIAAGTTASLTIVDNDAEPTVSLKDVNFRRTGLQITPSVSETTGASNTFEVVLSRSTYRDVFVDLTFSGTAIYGTDYVTTGISSSGGITIPAGQTSATFKISAINDRVYEGSEDIKIKVRNVSNAANEKTPKELTVNVYDSSSKLKPVVKKNTIEDAGDLAGTTLIMPPGSLPGDTRLSIEVSELLSRTDLEALGIITNGQPTVINDRNDPLVPLTLNLPIGLSLNGGPLSETTLFFDANFNGVQDFLDLNGNGTQDDDEPNETSVLSQADGSSAFEFDSAFDLDDSGFLEPSEGRLVAANGIDTATGLPWEARMTAPMGIFSLTPLTTLVESVQRTQFLTVPDAIDRVVTAFGIDGYELRFGNPLYNMLSGDALAAKAYAAHIQLFTTVLEITQLFNGLFNNTLNVGTISETVFEQMAASIAVEGSILDLSNITVIRGIINGVGTRLGFAASDAIVNGTNGENGAAGIIAQHMQIMQGYDATNTTAFPTRRDFAEQIIKAKVVMQGDSATRLRDVGAGTINISVAYSEFTGPALQARITAAHAGVVVPAAVGVTDSQIVEGDSGQQFMEFTVVIVGEHEGNVGVSYSTFDGTATAESGDYGTTTGTLTWAAGDMTSRTVQVPINGDNVAELDEFLTLALTEATNASIRRQEGTGYIQNNDDLALDTSLLAPAGDSNVVMIMDGQDGGLYQNGTPLLQGLIVSPLDSMIQGADNRTDNLTLNFGVERYRADNYSFVGGNGTGVDQLTTQGGTFSIVRHTLLSSATGQSVFVPAEAETVPTTVNWDQLEGFSFDVSSVGTFVLRVPASISNVIVEDADGASEGTMHIRSTTGQFAPITFTNPSTSIVIVKDNPATTVSVVSTDVAFSGSIQEQATFSLLNRVNSLAENTSTTSRVKVADLQINSLGGLNPTVSLIGTNASSFEVVGNSVFLKAGTSLNFETQPSLTVTARLTDSSGLSVDEVHNLSITDVTEFTGVVIGNNGSVSGQRSVLNELVIPFDSAVTVEPGAFVVVKRGPGGGTVTTNVALSVVGGKTTARLTFSGGFTRAGSFSLLDGNYQLTIDGSKIRDAATNQQLDVNNDGVAGGLYQFGDTADEAFYSLFGDVNGDRKVDNADKLLFNGALRKRTGQVGFNSAFDSDGDGDVDALDSLFFTKNFGKLLLFE